MKNDKSGLFGGISNLWGRGPSGKLEAPAVKDAQAERSSSHKQVSPVVGNRELVDLVQIGQSHPCHRCPAPCCRLVTHDTHQPVSFMDFDYIRFVLLHRKAELHLRRNDSFSFGYWGSCQHLDESVYQCKVHLQPEQPKTCVYYNPYNCFYKRNFVGDTVVDILRLDLRRFDVWMKELMFDSDGRLIFVPTFERSVEVVKDTPLDLKFELLPEKKVFPQLVPA